MLGTYNRDILAVQVPSKSRNQHWKNETAMLMTEPDIYKDLVVLINNTEKKKNQDYAEPTTLLSSHTHTIIAIRHPNPSFVTMDSNLHKQSFNPTSTWTKCYSMTGRISSIVVYHMPSAGSIYVYAIPPGHRPRPQGWKTSVYTHVHTYVCRF